MPTDEGLLTLVEKSHIPYFEREKYGFSSPDVVPISRLVDLIVGELLANGRFPRNEENYGSVEGMWIVKDSKGFAVCASRSSAGLPNVVVEKSETHFSSPKDAARYFLKWNCQLPGTFDGVCFI